MKSSYIFGVGINDNCRPSGAGGSGNMTKEYKTWKSMLQRCYEPASLLKCPAYSGCCVSDNFKRYSFFYDWYRSRVGYDKNFHIDKDLLLFGNNQYHEDLCVLLPKEINIALTLGNSRRGEYLLGVNKTQDGRFVARCWQGDKGHVYLGRYKDQEAAHVAYCQSKDAYIQSLAEKYVDQIDERAVEKLKSFSVVEFVKKNHRSTGECEACQ